MRRLRITTLEIRDQISRINRAPLDTLPGRSTTLDFGTREFKPPRVGRNPRDTYRCILCTSVHVVNLKSGNQSFHVYRRTVEFHC